MRGVKSSRALKYLILLLFLSLTLAWKVIARATPHEQPTDRSIQVRLAEFLVGQHFSVSMMERAEQGKPGVTASSGSCRMLVIRSPALGWDRDLIRRRHGQVPSIGDVLRAGPGGAGDGNRTRVASLED